jgi:hypothetical protein
MRVPGVSQGRLYRRRAFHLRPCLRCQFGWIKRRLPYTTLRKNQRLGKPCTWGLRAPKPPERLRRSFNPLVSKRRGAKRPPSPQRGRSPKAPSRGVCAAIRKGGFGVQGRSPWRNVCSEGETCIALREEIPKNPLARQSRPLGEMRAVFLNPRVPLGGSIHARWRSLIEKRKGWS